MVNEIPAWLSHALNKSEAHRIEAAVSKAELSTSGEIVPMLVQRSIYNASAPLVAALLLLMLGLFVKHLLWIYWGAMGHDLLWALIFLFCAGLGYALGLSSWGQHALLPRAEKKRQVQQRALLEFYAAGLKKTEGRTGILLFVSWAEHQAIVLADEGIARHCQPETFQVVVDELIRGAKSGDLAGGFERAIGRCKDILSAHFPRDSEDINELRDHLVIKN